MNWCEKATKMSVRTNANSPSQVANAIAFGASELTLSNRAHVFRRKSVGTVRQMILADNEVDRRKALKKLLPYQRRGFRGFLALEGRPATIRLLDPPLHEFCPMIKCWRDLARSLSFMTSIKKRVEDLHEFNPMLGHRGCRLGISYSEITEMQAQAILKLQYLFKRVALR